MDYFILDKKEKTIRAFDDRVQDSFLDGLTNISRIKDEKNKKDGSHKITIIRENEDEPIIIEIDKENRIIGYENHSITKVSDGFLNFNINLSRLELPNLREAGERFLAKNMDLKILHMPELIKAENYFLGRNQIIEEFDAPNLTEVGDCFLSGSDRLKKVNVPSLKKKGGCFLLRIQNEEDFKERLTINSTDLANADKKNMLTSPEINQAKLSIENIQKTENTKTK